MKNQFEVGVVYKRGAQFYLAVDVDALLTFRAGVAAELHPHDASVSRFQPLRVISCADLAARGGVSGEVIDAAAARWLAPCISGVRAEPRSRARPAGGEEAVSASWCALRTVRYAG